MTTDVQVKTQNCCQIRAGLRSIISSSSWSSAQHGTVTSDWLWRESAWASGNVFVPHH